MHIEDCTTPEEIRQVLNAALEYFDREGSPEKCKREYDKAYDRVNEIWNDYHDILPEPPKHSDDYRTGARDIRVWSQEADKVIKAIPHKLDLKILDNIIAQFKTLDEVPASARSVIDNDLWQKAQKKAKKEQSEAAGNILKFAKQHGREPYKQATPSEKALERRPKAIRIYMEMDPNFTERLPELQKTVVAATGNIGTLLASATPTGRLITAYCKLTDRSLDQYRITVYTHFKRDAVRFDSALMEGIFFPKIGDLYAIKHIITILTRIRRVAVSTGKKGLKDQTRGESKQPTIPRGYIGSQDIINSTLRELRERLCVPGEGNDEYKIPRATLGDWQKHDDVPGGTLEGGIKYDPTTHEVWYPKKWFKTRLKKYTPRTPKP